jgi:hypothetical protein
LFKGLPAIFNMNKNKIIKNNNLESIMARPEPPGLFSIPRPYEDDYERNDAWYKKMQRLEIKIRQLKQRFNQLSERQNIRKQETKEIIQVSKKLVNNFLNNKTKD